MLHSRLKYRDKEEKNRYENPTISATYPLKIRLVITEIAHLWSKESGTQDLFDGNQTSQIHHSKDLRYTLALDDMISQMIWLYTIISSWD